MRNDMGIGEFFRGKRVTWVVLSFLMLAFSFFFLEYYGRQVQIGLHGFLYGNGQWTKAQKEATIYLSAFIETGDESYYSAFQDVSSVIEGDRLGREMLMSGNYDRQEVFDQFIRGKNLEEDIPNLIWLMESFQSFDFLQRVISIWEEGDREFLEVKNLAESIFSEHENNLLDEERREFYRMELLELEDQLTELESEFAFTVRETARWAGDLVFWISIAIKMIFIMLVAGIAILFLKSQEKANIKLDESARKLKNVLENSRDVIYEYVPGQKRYEYMSKSVTDMLGYPVDIVTEGGPGFIIDRIHPEDLERIEKRLEELNDSEDTDGLMIDTEFRVRKKDGDYVWVNNKRNPILDSEGKMVAVVGNVRDISDEKSRLNQIDESLREKQMLLSEIHHRVKNNLAIVSSLIELQKDRLDERGREELAEVQMRIKSIALVHDKLYSTSSFADINLSQYARELTEMIRETYRSDERDVEIRYHLEDLQFDITNAVTMALILNEMINNCFKHAFEDDEEGLIDVTIRTEEDEVILEVADSGAKLPQDFDPNSMQSMGMTLIYSLTMQLEGDLKIWVDDKTHFLVQFPDPSVKEKVKSSKAIES